MVTLDNMDKKTLGDLASVLSASSKTWDLVDLKKKDQWMIKTLAVLGEDPEAKTAVMKGPITLEIVRAAEPGLSLAAAKKKVEELTATFEEAAARGYRLLLPRLDLSARPAIASRIVRECAADELGHDLWKIIEEESDTASKGAQKQLKRDLKAFKLKQSTPTGKQLADALVQLEALFLLIDGNTTDDVEELVELALDILPSSGAVGDDMRSFAGTMRALVSASAAGGGAMFKTFEAFKKETVKQYESLLNAAIDKDLNHVGQTGLHAPREC